VRGVKEGSRGLRGGGTTAFDHGNADAIAIKFKRSPLVASICSQASTFL